MDDEEHTAAYEAIVKREKISVRGVVKGERVEIRTDHHHYSVLDTARFADIEAVITNTPGLDGAILVVDAIEGPTEQTKRSVQLARQLGVRHIVVAINKCDMVDEENEASIESVEQSARELLNESEFPGDDVAAVKVSALKALEDDPGCGQTILDLLGAVDENVSEPST